MAAADSIAFFDSGMGGLTVLQEALRVMPTEHYIYFADSKAAPYGTRPTVEIETLVLRAIHFLTERHALKALVVACNTATSVAIDTLRARYNFPIIGMEPAIKPALACAQSKRVLVCATEKTLHAPKLQHLIHDLGAEHRIQRLSLQHLVGFAEASTWDGPVVEQYLIGQLGTVDWSSIGGVVLGCTHFPYYKPLLQRLIPAHIPILDGHAGTVRHLQQSITPTPSPIATPLVYYRSGEALPSSALTSYLERSAFVLD